MEAAESKRRGVEVQIVRVIERGWSIVGIVRLYEVDWLLWIMWSIVNARGNELKQDWGRRKSSFGNLYVDGIEKEFRRITNGGNDPENSNGPVAYPAKK